MEKNKAPARIWLHGVGSGEKVTWADHPNPWADFGEEATADSVEYVRVDRLATRDAAPDRGEG